MHCHDSALKGVKVITLQLLNAKSTLKLCKHISHENAWRLNRLTYLFSPMNYTAMRFAFVDCWRSIFF